MRLEGSSEDCLVQLPFWIRVSHRRLPRTIVSWVFSFSNNGDSTASLDNLFHCFTTMRINKMFLLSITEKNLLYFLPTGYIQLQDFPHPEPCLFQMKQRIFKEYLDQTRNQCKCKKQTKKNYKKIFNFNYGPYSKVVHIDILWKKY